MRNNLAIASLIAVAAVIAAVSVIFFSSIEDRSIYAVSFLIAALVAVLFLAFKNAANASSKVKLMVEAIRNNDFSMRFHDKNNNGVNRALEKISAIIRDEKQNARRNERYYGLIMDKVNAGIFAADEKGKVELCNDGMLKLLGVSAFTYLEQLERIDKELKNELLRVTGIDLPIEEWSREAEVDADVMAEKIIAAVETSIKAKNQDVPPELVKMVEKSILLQVLDQLWKDHIAALDQMRHTIVLRAYGQKDPLNEYKKEAFNMFSLMLDQLREKLTFLICRAQIQMGAMDTLQSQEVRHKNLREIHEEPTSLVHGQAQRPSEPEPEAEKRSPFVYNSAEFDPNNPETWGKISRNDPCPCGSGLKYKHCHGKI